MRFSSALLVGVFAAFASAQSATPTVSSAVVQSSVEAVMVKCLAACDAGDVTCRAKCIAVPSPDVAQANATNNCVSDCPQGNGTATDNLNYENCVAGCITEHYFTSTGTPAPTTAAGGSGGDASVAGATGTATGSTTGTDTGTAAGKTGSAGGTASGTATDTATGTAGSATTASKSAGNELRVASSALGLLSFAATLFSL